MTDDYRLNPIVTQGREHPYSTADFRADLAEAQAQIRRWMAT